ncbi:hypothetical protein [uncultured Chryseobacterium sp.]|uniref:hypothetical protein n=1 Tax=uncultured Chryseobacterium sp. TaxID=259322 RepID=UPI0025F4D3DF|nr:hypothetical protein [uncultured Chryseobacterium sp.]
MTSCTTTATWIDDPFPSFPGSHGGGAAEFPSIIRKIPVPRRKYFIEYGQDVWEAEEMRV